MLLAPFENRTDNAIVNIFLLLRSKSESYIGFRYATTPEERMKEEEWFKSLVRFNRTGLFPRQIRYILGSYNPPRERRLEYKVFDRIRERIGKHPRITQQCLNNRLAGLVFRNILAKRNRRYVQGRCFSTNEWKIQETKKMLDETPEKFWWSEHGVVQLVRPYWLEESGLRASYRKELSMKLDELVESMHLEWLKARSGKWAEKWKRRELDYLKNDWESYRSGRFPIFPLIVIDPNRMMLIPDVMLAFDRAMEKWETKEILPHVPANLKNKDGKVWLSKMKKPIFVYR